jgi:hypothetical protein
MSENLSNSESDGMPCQDYILKNVPDKMSKRMQDRMADRLSEHGSERISMGGDHFENNFSHKCLVCSLHPLRLKRASILFATARLMPRANPYCEF